MAVTTRSGELGSLSSQVRGELLLGDGAFRQRRDEDRSGRFVEHDPAELADALEKAALHVHEAATQFPIGGVIAPGPLRDGVGAQAAELVETFRWTREWRRRLAP